MTKTNQAQGSVHGTFVSIHPLFPGPPFRNFQYVLTDTGKIFSYHFIVISDDHVSPCFQFGSPHLIIGDFFRSPMLASVHFYDQPDPVTAEIDDEFIIDGFLMSKVKNLSSFKNEEEFIP